MKNTYCKFLYHCYIDTEVDNKETFTKDHMWELFKTFMADINKVREGRRRVGERRVVGWGRGGEGDKGSQMKMAIHIYPTPDKHTSLYQVQSCMLTCVALPCACHMTCVVHVVT